MFTKANWYYIWNSRKKFPIGGLLSWLGITVAAIILGVSDGIQGLSTINELLAGSDTPAQSGQGQNPVGTDSKILVPWVIGIIVFPSLLGSLVNYLEGSKEQKRSSQISRQYLHPQLNSKLEDLFNKITTTHTLSGDFRVYIVMPYPRRLLFWNYRICFSYNTHPNDNDVSIKVNAGELGYLIKNLQSLQSQKYVPQILSLYPNYPLGYTEISQHNRNLINGIFAVRNVAVIGLFDQSFICGALVVTTSDDANVSILAGRPFKDSLAAFVNSNEQLINTIWQTTEGRS